MLGRTYPTSEIYEVFMVDVNFYQILWRLWKHLEAFYSPSVVFSEESPNFVQKWETPILFLASRRQMAFLGGITHKRLSIILSYRHPLLIYMIKLMLDENFLMADHRYHVNSNISSMFLAMSLGKDFRNPMSKKLSKDVFKNQILGGMDDILRNIDNFLDTSTQRLL